jgi:glutaredoxin
MKIAVLLCVVLRVFLCALCLCSAAHAEKLYKVVGPDGKITYTDRPPEDGKSKISTMEIQSAPSTPLPDAVLKYQAELQKSMQNRLAAAKEMGSIGTPVLFSAAWCGYCTKAKAYLSAKKINYREVDIDTEDGAKSYFEAGGKTGIPLLVAGAKRQQGFSDASYDSFFGLKK